jgi:hypothetical protein
LTCTALRLYNGIVQLNKFNTKDNCLPAARRDGMVNNSVAAETAGGRRSENTHQKV